MRCGVPPEEQIPDTPCCTEEVTIIANQLWPVDFPGKSSKATFPHCSPLLGHPDF